MILAELIKEAYRNNGIVVAYVFGPFGYGKTSYALWTAYHVYGSWEKALSHLYFSPLEAMPEMHRAADTGKRIPLIIFDDAGLWLDKMTWWEQHKIAFVKFFNIIRSIAAGVIFTCPSTELPKLLMKKANFRVRVTPLTPPEAYKILGEEGFNKLREVVRRYGLREEYACATGYQLVTLPSFMSIVSKKWKDVYPLHYPVHEQYLRKRMEAVRQYFNELAEKLGYEDRARRRERIIEEIRELAEQGLKRNEIAKAIREKYKLPRSTAYYYIKQALGPAKKT